MFPSKNEIYTESILGSQLGSRRLKLMAPYWDHKGKKSLDKKYRKYYKTLIAKMVSYIKQKIKMSFT